MKALLLLTLTALCACGEPSSTIGMRYEREGSHVGALERVQVGTCTYVLAHQHNGCAIVHAGDCPNHAHADTSANTPRVQ